MLLLNWPFSETVTRTSPLPRLGQCRIYQTVFVIISKITRAIHYCYLECFKSGIKHDTLLHARLLPCVNSVANVQSVQNVNHLHFVAGQPQIKGLRPIVKAVSL